GSPSAEEVGPGLAPRWQSEPGGRAAPSPGGTDVGRRTGRRVAPSAGGRTREETWGAKGDGPPSRPAPAVRRGREDDDEGDGRASPEDERRSPPEA
ncbi:hypothetical protein THAOC_32172, partial [Thalassiosira oceanica]